MAKYTPIKNSLESLKEHNDKIYSKKRTDNLDEEKKILVESVDYNIRVDVFISKWEYEKHNE